jgi:hypothetical protein
VAHEAKNQSALPFERMISATVDALGYSLQHASRLKNKGRQDNATQIGARAQLRDDVSENCVHCGQPGVSLYRPLRGMAGELACESPSS